MMQPQQLLDPAYFSVARYLLVERGSQLGSALPPQLQCRRHFCSTPAKRRSLTLLNLHVRRAQRLVLCLRVCAEVLCPQQQQRRRRLDRELVVEYVVRESAIDARSLRPSHPCCALFFVMWWLLLTLKMRLMSLLRRLRLLPWSGALREAVGWAEA